MGFFEDFLNLFNEFGVNIDSNKDYNSIVIYDENVCVQVVNKKHKHKHKHKSTDNRQQFIYLPDIPTSVTKYKKT